MNHPRLNPQEPTVVVDKVVVEAKVAVEKGNRLHKQPAIIMANLNGTIFMNTSF
jgi:hypothetical protein